MKILFGMVGLIIVSVPCLVSAGKCSGTQIEKMLDKGFSKQEINKLCTDSKANGLAIDLNGQWRFISESQYGNINEYWRISWDGRLLAISARRQHNMQYTWVPLNILEQQVSGRNLRFTLKENAYSINQYDMTIKGSDRIEGQYKTRDTIIRDMGGASVDKQLSVPTDFGSAQHYGGSARLIRE